MTKWAENSKTIYKNYKPEEPKSTPAVENDNLITLLCYQYSKDVLIKAFNDKRVRKLFLDLAPEITSSDCKFKATPKNP